LVYGRCGGPAGDFARCAREHSAAVVGAGRESPASPAASRGAWNRFPSTMPENHGPLADASTLDQLITAAKAILELDWKRKASSARELLKS
jgi:hypothetical protein